MNITLVLLGLAVPSAALAQTTVPDWARKVRTGAPIYVTTSAGESVDGTAGQITSTSMVVSTRSGQRTVLLDDVAKVQKPDSAANGAMNGALVGLLGGVLSFATTDCGSDLIAPTCQAAAFGGNLIVVPAIGAGIGWAIDAAIRGRDTIFDVKRDKGGRRVALGFGPRTIHARIAF
ncbi:MAG TPA: hypothetical protein VMN81_05250 [Vicinamibacterales bacterium]|nr:hypothetical protein [Vicinamibacterales bacterium]